MSKLNIPEGYQQVMPYLILPNANGFLAFTQKVFGAKEKYKVMRDENTIMHGEIQIGDNIIMFADSTAEYPPQAGSFFIYVEDADKTYKQALDAGATTIAAPGDKEYGRSGGVKDAFGNSWWITSVK